MTQSLSYWEKIPLWDLKNPEQSFNITLDRINGRIPVTRLEKWKDFSILLESPFFNQADVQFIFRGQRRYDWGMTPTIARFSDNGIVSEEIAMQQLDMFRKAIRGRISDYSLLDGSNDREFDELWSIGQHHGLNTPLLDWTYSPYVALFFAFVKEDQQNEIDNEYRAVYILNKSIISKDEICPDIRIFEPRKDDYKRLVSQAGLFTFPPYDTTIENKLAEVLADENFPDDKLKNADERENEEPGIIAQYICKVYIKNENRRECLNHLRKMNVHHASLFPDIFGAAKYCNTIIGEVEFDEAIKKTAIAEKVETGVEFDLGGYKDLAVVQNATSILELLKSTPESKEVEPGRIKLIADELDGHLAKSMVVDWQTRDTVQAEMKNATRVILRKFGYPVNARNTIIDNILDIIGKGNKQ